MSNDYFQFREFRIEQGRSAMKVTTDACIQGAWTPVLPHIRRVLDIGAGSGLLSLMLAQRNSEIAVDAIEIDADAAQQAAENVIASPWKNRVNIIHGDARSHVFGDKYDLIISNPPFFSNSLLSNDASKDNARHTLRLSQPELLAVINSNLAKDGYASVMLPLAEYLLWTDLAGEMGFFESYRLSVSHTDDAPVKRIVGLFSKNEPSFVQGEALVIKDGAQRYSQAFIDLLSPFYLDL